MTTNNTNLVRANKLTVKVDANGRLTADLYRTHKMLATIKAEDTKFQPDTNATKSATREDFRKFIAEHASEYGFNYDPADRRTEDNIRKATYKTDADLIEDAVAMVAPDIATFISKMPHAEMVKSHTITIESITPKTKTSKGSDLVMLGIEDGRYLSNGNMAWFDIEGIVTMDCNGTEIYQTIKMELVSGQLKKFRMTQTQWNTETTTSLIEAGIVTKEEPKESKPKDKSSKKTAEPKDTTKKTTRKPRNSKKAEDKVEG